MNYTIIPRRGDYRRRNSHIIITQMKNLYEIGTTLSPHLKRGNYLYTWGDWQQYFQVRLNHRRQLPVHYYMELLSDDYVIYQGLNFQEKSYFLKELANEGMIPFKYRDAILIALNEDFELDLMDDRMTQHLSDKLLTNLMKEYSIDKTRIYLLDDILVDNWKDIKEHNDDMVFDIELHKYFNRTIFHTILRRYMKW